MVEAQQSDGCREVEMLYYGGCVRLQPADVSAVGIGFQV